MNESETDAQDLISGVKLYASLGFNSYRAFYNHVSFLSCAVPIFRQPNRKGWFANRSDVLRYLKEVSKAK